MATIAPVITDVGGPSWGAAYIVQWTPVTNADTCSAVEMPAWADRSVQIAGTFNGATVEFEGSNDGTNYVDLTDPQGNAISKTAAAIEVIEEVTRYMKPVFSGGGGSQSLTVTLLITGYRAR